MAQRALALHHFSVFTTRAYPRAVMANRLSTSDSLPSKEPSGQPLAGGQRSTAAITPKAPCMSRQAKAEPEPVGLHAQALCGHQTLVSSSKGFGRSRCHLTAGVRGLCGPVRRPVGSESLLPGGRRLPPVTGHASRRRHRAGALPGFASLLQGPTKVPAVGSWFDHSPHEPGQAHVRPPAMPYPMPNRHGGSLQTPPSR